MNLQETINNEIKDAKAILDVCAGNGHWLRNWKGIKHAVEANSGYNEHLMRHGYEVIENRPIQTINFIDGIYYDVIMCIDGIEHLSQEEGLEVLENLEKHSGKVIIFTPNEFNNNIHNANKLNEPLQEHKSVWPKEFWLDRGYKIVYEEFNSTENINNILYVLTKEK